MGGMGMQALRKMGVSDEDIALAQATQDGQRRAGHPVQPLAEILGLIERRAAQRQDAKRSDVIKQAVLNLDRPGILPHNSKQVPRARAKGDTPIVHEEAQLQLEFDFRKGGNMGMGHEYFDAITQRLAQHPITPAQRLSAIAALHFIGRHLEWEYHSCTKMASELADYMGIKPQQMSRILKLLEDVGAIYRVKAGTEKAIVVSPEGIWRGKFENHAAAVQRFKLEVIDGGKAA